MSSQEFFRASGCRAALIGLAAGVLCVGVGRASAGDFPVETDQQDGLYRRACENLQPGATGVCIKTTVFPLTSGYFEVYSGVDYKKAALSNEFAVLPPGNYRAYVPGVPSYSAAFEVVAGQVTEVEMGTLSVRAFSNPELQIGHDTQVGEVCEQGLFIDSGSTRFAIPLAPGLYVLDFGGRFDDPDACIANEIEVQVDLGTVTRVHQRH